MRVLALKIFFSVVASNLLMAQEIIGTAIINGERIQIFDNKTWKFTNNSEGSFNEDCDVIKYQVHFCNSFGWNKVENPVAPINAQYDVDGRTYSMFIVEPMGTADGVSREVMAGVALDYAAAAADVDVSEIPQHFVREGRVNGYDYLSVSYSAGVSGMEFTFINNIFVMETVTVQATIYTIGTAVSDSLEENNTKLVKAIDFR